jgi:hypothetical protein
MKAPVEKRIFDTRLEFLEWALYHEKQEIAKSERLLKESKQRIDSFKKQIKEENKK